MNKAETSSNNSELSQNLEHNVPLWIELLNQARQEAKKGRERLSTLIKMYQAPEWVGPAPTTEELQAAYEENKGLLLVDKDTPEEYLQTIARVESMYSAWNAVQVKKYSELSNLAYLDVGQTDEEQRKAAEEIEINQRWFSEVSAPWADIERKWNEEVDFLFRGEFSQFAHEISSRIELVANQVHANDQLSADLRVSFISQTIRAKLDLEVASNRLSQADADALFQEILARESKLTPEEEISDSRKSIGLVEIKRDEQYLQKKVHLELLDQMFQDIKASLITDIEAPVSGLIPHWEVEDIIYGTENSSRQKESKLEDVIILKENRRNPPRQIRNVEMWMAMAKNPSVRQIFGEEYIDHLNVLLGEKFREKIIYADIVPASVEASQYFASPELIKDLFFEFVHAQHFRLKEAFQHIAQLPNFLELVPQICQKYPELGRDKESFLVNWKNLFDLKSDDHDPENFSPAQLERIQSLALRLLNEDQLSPNEMKAAKATLETPVLFKWILEKYELDFPEVAEILQALQLCKSEYSARKNESFESKNSPLETVFREALYRIENMDRSQSGLIRINAGGFQSLIPNIHKLAAKIIAEKSPEKRRILMSTRVAEFIINVSIGKSKKDFLLEEAMPLFEGRDVLTLIDTVTLYSDAYANPDGARLLVKLWDSCDLVRNDEARIIDLVAENKLHADVFLSLRTELPFIFSKKWEEVWELFKQDPESLLNSTEQIQFYKQLIAEHGKIFIKLLKQYQKYRNSLQISEEDHEDIIEMLRHIRVLSPSILEGYKVAKIRNTVELYISGLQSVMDKMVGKQSLSEADRSKPYYADLIQNAYANNSDNWTSYKSNDSCQDRSADLAGLVIKDRYQIDLKAASEMTLTSELSQENIDYLKSVILNVSTKAQEFHFDQEKMRKYLNDELRRILSIVHRQGSLKHISAEDVTSNTDLLFLLQAESLYGNSEVYSSALKKFMLFHLFTEYENIQAYIRGTSDRVSGSKHPDYALLAELHSFFNDRIKEAGKDIAESALKNPLISEEMARYFQEFTDRIHRKSLQERLTKMQANKLGLSESFIESIGKLLNKNRKVELSPEKVAEIIQRYERMIDLTKDSTSLKSRTRALHGQIRSQVSKTAKAMAEVLGKDVSSTDILLTDWNMDELISAKRQFEAGSYDQEMFAAYTVQKVIDMFSKEVDKVDQELKKFASTGGSDNQMLNAYITKSKESAHARMVGGVCVSGDNPDKSPENMWNMPNFLQMVLEDPETKRCQGVVMMHVEHNLGKKILALSINPSSTYLYQSDEKALFSGILNTVIGFAKDNYFDTIAVSQDVQIRTNRTGGLFEQALKDQISAVNKSFEFSEKRVFSYNPTYKMDQMDVLWENIT